jgi:hypothetical protein
VRLVVLGVEEQPVVAAERFRELAVGEELLLHPERAGHEEGRKPRGATARYVSRMRSNLSSGLS